MKKLLVLCIGMFFVVLAYAQLDYYPELCQNFQGTYTDLGSNGSVISTSNFDDANSLAQAIGFNFDYNGTLYSHFILNTNGFIKLGTSASMTAPSSANLSYTYYNQNNYGGAFNSSNVNDVNVEHRLQRRLRSRTKASGRASIKNGNFGTPHARDQQVAPDNLRATTVPSDL